MKYELGKTEEHQNRLIGRRDAFHVACVLCDWDEDYGSAPEPGMRVRFTGDAFGSVRPAKANELAHGVIDPFLTSKPRIDDDMFWVLLMPGLASAPQHNFELKIPVDGDMQKGQWDCRDCD